LAGFLGTTNERYFGRYSEATLKHYIPWRDRTYNIVKGNIGYVDTIAFHLFHGTLKNRHYSKRHTKLKEYNFDPSKHIKRNEDGIYQLSEECPQSIKDWINSYMLEMRNEP
jgi:hypothetical protein